MRNYLFITAILFVTNLVFSQENPWAVRGENPWIYQQGENPWVGYESNLPVEPIALKEVSEIDTFYIVSLDTVAKDTVAVPIIKPKQKEKAIDRPTDLLIQMGARKDYPASGDFLRSIILSSLFNIFALPVDLIVAAIPTNEQNYANNDFMLKYPNATVNQKETYRREITKQRFRKMLSGSVIGIGINVVLIIVLSNV